MDRLDPELAANEHETLVQFLDYQRATMLAKADRLDEAQLRQPLAPSDLTLAGLLKHLALVEDNWMQVRFLGRPETELDPWGDALWDDDRDWEFHSALTDSGSDLRDLYRAACSRSREAISGASLDAVSVGRDRDGQQWSLRWILVHLIEETARHNGHADLLRQAIDGEVGE